ncbi:DNA polymerase [uncultured phage cr105_1]|uniref:DNA polymerase n=1 Tax=uncultured phage cr105_1 TaxID=2986415 RepID=A0AAE7RZD8_9CAUD|nr:DNA polymerase [uncultured phage cr105_1]QWM90753.1 DNA polymerase [uncultured phage cr105_1]
MIIRDKIVYVYDVEVFPNVFHCTVKNTETGELHKFEISCRRNQLDELVEFFHTVNTKYTFGDLYTTDIKLDTNILFCGYNNLHYDNAIINYIIDCYNIMKYKGYRDICRSVFNLSKVITTSSEDDNSAWRKWKYMICFDSFDILTMLYSNKLRVGLKEIQVTMQYKNVQEFVADWQADLPENQIDSMIDYNINDVNSTEELLNRCKKDIDLRIAIEDEYGVRVLSKDGVNIGMKILTQKYLEKTGQTWWDIKDLRSPMSVIPLNNVILPFIKYDSPILTRVLNDMKSQIVSPGRKGYENKFVFEGLQYSVGVGGIHSVNKPEIIIPKEDEMLIDIDVASLYPSMLIEYKFYPKHLGPEFLEVYKQIKDERIEAKHNGNKVKNETLKLALNGLSGNLQNEHNFCYSPFAVMQIRINGQLLLLMLAEKLTQLGCRIVQANTDGLFVLLKKDVYSKVNNVCREWEQLTRLTLEEERFKAMYQYAINDYFAITEDDKVKEKGMFITTVKLGKGLTPKIIPKAVINFFKNGVPVEETIKGCKDIRDFLMSEKTGKQWHVEYNNKEQQRTNRFYASTNGAYLWKWKEKDTNRFDISIPCPTEKQYQNMLTASGVTLLNYLDDKPIEERKINYRYYIMEAYKIIRELKPLQMSLWD